MCDGIRTSRLGSHGDRSWRCRIRDHRRGQQCGSATLAYSPVSLACYEGIHRRGHDDCCVAYRCTSAFGECMPTIPHSGAWVRGTAWLDRIVGLQLTVIENAVSSFSLKCGISFQEIYLSTRRESRRSLRA